MGKHYGDVFSTLKFYRDKMNDVDLFPDFILEVKWDLFTY